MDRPAKVIGQLLLSDGNKEKRIDVLGITPRTRLPSLDLRWSISGVYVLRLATMTLLSIPKDRVRGRDPTPWQCVEEREAWRIWWTASHLPLSEKKRRCPAAFHLIGD